MDKVICPASVICGFDDCMHSKPHIPIEFEGGNCLTTSSSCLIGQGKCQSTAEIPDFEVCPDELLRPFYPLKICKLNDKPCIRQEGLTCPTYEDSKKEKFK